jgi:membrane protease YdiL (CAAX protease family)
MMKRLGIFLRSVIPADPYQLVFLVAVVFLIVSPRLAWWSSKILESSGAISSTLGGVDRQHGFVQLMAIWFWPIIFAGLAGYFVCFWPGKTPVRRILWAVCFPTVLSLVLILYEYFQLTRSVSSVFELHSSYAVLKWIQLNVWRLPTGFYFCAVGSVLILAYMLRFALGLTSLPLSWPNEHVPSDRNADSWPRVRQLVFVLVGPYFMIAGLLGILVFGLAYTGMRTISPSFMDLLGRLAPVLDAVLLVGIAVYILGKPGRDAARTSLNLPEPRNALLGLILAFAVSSLIPGTQYLADRAHWAAHDFGKLAPPQFSSYFGVTNAWQPWLLLMAFGAFAEEILFRGLLLPKLLGRYGLYRGIFLTGIVWAAIHFRSDTYSGLSVGGVLVHLANRVLLCLALNFVFAWMTLRWISVIPAAVAHTTWNILVTLQPDSSQLWDKALAFVLWAILAYVLFRFWPLSGEETSEGIQSEANPEPAS